MIFPLPSCSKYWYPYIYAVFSVLLFLYCFTIWLYVIPVFPLVSICSRKYIFRLLSFGVLFLSITFHLVNTYSRPVSPKLRISLRIHENTTIYKQYKWKSLLTLWRMFCYFIKTCQTYIKDYNHVLVRCFVRFVINI